MLSSLKRGWQRIKKLLESGLLLPVVSITPLVLVVLLPVVALTSLLSTTPIPSKM